MLIMTSCYYHAPLIPPLTFRRTYILLTQSNVTKRTQLEMAMARLADSQIRMLGQVRV